MRVLNKVHYGYNLSYQQECEKQVGIMEGKGNVLGGGVLLLV